MQRWIAVGVVAFLLCMGGGYFGLKAYKQSRPGPIWVPLAINPELGREQRKAACAQLKDYLTADHRLLAVVRDLKLAAVWSLASDEAAATELKRRVFIREGSTQTEMGDVPSINVGLNGTQKEKPMTEKIVIRIMEDVKSAINKPARHE